MADAVGLAASMASLIQITTGVTKLTYSYFSSVRDAHTTSIEYRNEVTSLIDVLFQLGRALGASRVPNVLIKQSREASRLVRVTAVARTS